MNSPKVIAIWLILASIMTVAVDGACTAYTTPTNGAFYCTTDGTVGGTACTTATGCICQTSCNSGYTLTGLATQTCQASGSWTGLGSSNIVCVDERTIIVGNSVCEMLVNTNTMESCSVCKTLLWEPFDLNFTGRWQAFDAPLVTNGPSVWTAMVVGGATTVTNTRTINCSPASALCVASSFIYQQGFSWSNYKVRLRYQYAVNSGNTFLGISFHTQDANNTYEVVVLGTNNQVVTLRKKVAGVVTNAWTASPASIPRLPNTWYNLEVECRFGKIRVWQEGQLVGQPYFDTTYTQGTVGIVLGYGISLPKFDSIMVQQVTLQHSLPAEIRLSTASLGSHTLYVNGVAQVWGGSTSVLTQTSITSTTLSSADWSIPISTRSIAIYSDSGSATVVGHIAVRALWQGLESGDGANWGWWCAPGFDSTWVQPGYQPDPTLNAGSPFALAKALATARSAGQNMYYSQNQIIDRYPVGMWTDPTFLQVQVTCVLPNATTAMKVSEPTLQNLNLSPFSFLPGAPYPFSRESWNRSDPTGYQTVSLASAWNTNGNPSTLSATTYPGLYIQPAQYDFTMDQQSRVTYTDLSGTGSMQIYRFGANFQRYNFSISFATIQAERLGTVWAWRDANNYYEYIQSFEANPGYHAVRKHINGFAYTQFITVNYQNRATNFTNFTLASEASGYTVLLNGIPIFQEDWDASLNSGSFGIQSMFYNSYFYNTNINFFRAQVGGGGNLGSWNSINVLIQAPSGGKVMESSAGGVTFWRHNHWNESWQNTHISASTQVSGWFANVSVSQDTFPATVGSYGLAFYWTSPDDYHEIVLSTTTTTVSLNKRGTGGSLLSTLCTGTVTVSALATTQRLLMVMARSGTLRVYVDKQFICSAVDPKSTVPLALSGEVLLMSDQRAGSPSATTIFQGLQFQWIPTTAQDTGMCGTAICACANGASCVTGKTWGSSTCTCTAQWTGTACTTPYLTYSQIHLTGNGLTGGAVGSQVYVNMTAYYNGSPTTNIDSGYASHFNVLVTFTNVFGFVTSTVSAPVSWAGTGSSLFYASYIVAYTGNVTVAVTCDGNVVGPQSTYSYVVPTGVASAGSFAASGTGLKGTIISTLSYINLIAQDSNFNEVQGSTSDASQIVATVQLASGSPFVVPITYSGIGGRYSGSYTPAVAGAATVTITSNAIAIVGSPFSLTVKAAATLPVYLTVDAPFSFKWTAYVPSSSETFTRYDVLVATDSSFNNAVSSAYTAAPSTYLSFVLKVKTQYYFKVSVRVLDAFSGTVKKNDLSATDYQYVYG